MELLNSGNIDNKEYRKVQGLVGESSFSYNSSQIICKCSKNR